MSREEITIGMVKSSQFSKIAKQAGQNKQAGRTYFSDLLNQPDGKNLKNLSKHALLLGTSE